jgi:hypothetical protein
VEDEDISPDDNTKNQNLSQQLANKEKAIPNNNIESEKSN